MDRETRFRVLFVESYPAVRRYAHHRGLSTSDAEDLVAEVFAVAWRRLDRVPLDDPIPWLLAVARNHWRNHLRRARRARDLTARLEAARSPAPAGDGGDFSFDDIGAAFRSLRERDREILRLVAWDDLTPEQAATVLGCSGVAARVRLHRARTRFAAALAARETNPPQPTPLTTTPPQRKEKADDRP